MHGIIILNNAVGAGFTPAQRNQNVQNVSDKHNIANFEITATALSSGAGASPAPTIGNIVGSYKSLVANTCLEIYKSKNDTMGKLWQRNYYEHIIRNEQSYHNISDYIINNPANWKGDKFYR